MVAFFDIISDIAVVFHEAIAFYLCLACDVILTFSFTSSISCLSLDATNIPYFCFQNELTTFSIHTIETRA